MTEHPTSTWSIGATAAIDAVVALLASLDDVPAGVGR
jgi:hypothetical protein